MIRNWFFTKRWLIAELEHARNQVTVFVAETIELADQVEELREQVSMATLTARLLREGARTLRVIDPARELNLAERGELTRLREREMTTGPAHLREGDTHV